MRGGFLAVLLILAVDYGGEPPSSPGQMMLSSPCHHSSLPTAHTLCSGLDRSRCQGVLQAACGSQVAFKPGTGCPQKPLQLFTPSVCSLPLHFKHIPLSPSLLHTSHWGSHPVHLLSQLAGTPQVLGTRQMGSSAGDGAVGPQPHAVTSCPSWGSTGSGTEWRSAVCLCLVAYCTGTVRLPAAGDNTASRLFSGSGTKKCI